MPNNEKDIAKCLLMLGGTYRVELDDITAEAYRIALEDVPGPLITAATRTVLKSPDYRFMPTPGQLRELAVTGCIGYTARAERAWIEFDRAVAHHGSDRSVTFADGLINATVRLLGDWPFCCGRTGDEYAVFLRRQFLATYRSLCTSGADESLRQPLMGNLWRENARFPSEALNRPKVNTGQVALVETSQPVLLPPSMPAKRLSERPANIPQLELRKP